MRKIYYGLMYPFFIWSYCMGTHS